MNIAKFNEAIKSFDVSNSNTFLNRDEARLLSEYANTLTENTQKELTGKLLLFYTEDRKWDPTLRSVKNMVEDVFDDSIIGYHTIVKLENLKTDEVYIESNYQKMRDRCSEKCKAYEAEVRRIYSYTRPSDGKPLNSIPFAEMTKEEKEMIDSLDTLWMKYV
jgi:hypothetical protein